MGGPEKSEYRFCERGKHDATELLDFIKSNRYDSSNLLQDAGIIEADVAKAVRCFDAVRNSRPMSGMPLFIFTLKDVTTGAMVGTSLVRGVSDRLCYEVHAREGRTSGILTIRHEAKGTFEFGGFLLAKEVRGKGLAKLLSYSRAIFLSTIAIPIERLLTEFLLYADGKEDGGDPYFWRSVSRQGSSKMPYHEAERLRRMYGGHQKLIQHLPTRIDFEACYGDMASEPNIHPDSRAARHLLAKIGFHYAAKAGFDGSACYEALWVNVKRIVDHARVTRQRIALGAGPRGCRRDWSIVASRGKDGFEARYAPVEVDSAQRIYFDPRDYESIPEDAGIFMF